MSLDDLRPIAPLADIPDVSFWIFISVVSLIIFSVGFVVIGLIVRWWNSRQENLSKKYLSLLKQIDWSNPKQAAYSATYYGRILAKERQSKEIYEQLLPLLEPYKYKKNTPKLDKKVLQQFKLLVQVLDGSI